MKYLFGKLAALQGLGYCVGQLCATLEYEKDLSSIKVDWYKQMIAEKKREILDLQNEILADINALNGEKVY